MYLTTFNLHIEKGENEEKKAGVEEIRIWYWECKRGFGHV